MIVAKNLYKNFGLIKAVDNLNFCINKGEVVALLGPNGAGKTTLMRLLTGYYQPSLGSVMLSEYDVAVDREKALKNIAYVPENGFVYNDMSVYEFLHFMAGLHNVSEKSFVENLVFISKQLELEEVINQKIETLSKGFKRRVGIAGALIHSPRILILDEPTEGLDPNQKFEIRRFIREYGRKNIVIVSTHIMEEVEAMATRVILMNHGKLIRDTTPEILKKISPDHNMEEAFRTITSEN